MQPQATNRSANRSDDPGFIFEPAGALVLNNEFSGLVVAPAHYIGFADRNHACP
jgi:hypothetical protein